MNDTQTIINILNKLKNKYSDNPPLIQFFLELGMNNHVNVSCIGFYKRFILENTDTDFTKDDIIKIEELYIKAKRILNILNRFVYNYKLKKAIKYNEEDLFFNNLSNFKKKHIVNIYSNKTIYSFRINDLINIWNDCLTKSENLFCKTTELKNPYTNMSFSINNLYNIFFAIKSSDYIMPTWILLFFYENFNINDFTYKYYAALKDIAIINFIKEGSLYEKIENIHNMLHEYRKDANYYVLKDNLTLVDKVCIFNILKDSLKKYLLSSLSCNPLVRSDNKSKLKEILSEYFSSKENKDLKIYFRSSVRYRSPITLNPLTRRILRRASQVGDISNNVSNISLLTRSEIRDISLINPFVPNHTIPRSPTRNTVIRNITRNQPIPLPPPPQLPYTNRYVNVPVTSIPPPPIEPISYTRNSFLPSINNAISLNVRENSDVEMQSINSEDEIEEDIIMEEIEEIEEEIDQPSIIRNDIRRRYDFRYFPR